MTAIVALETRALGLVLKDFAVRERNISVDSLLHLMEFDNRRGWVEFDCRSLWEFCKREMQLLDCATAVRLRCVKVLRRYPQAEAFLRDARMSVTTLAPLQKILNDDNANEVFRRAAGLSRKQIERVLAEFDPKTGPRTMIRALAPKTVEIEVEPTAEKPVVSPPPVASEDRHARESDDASAPVPVMPADTFVLTAQVARKLSVTIKPVNAREFALNATVDQDFVDALEEARDLYSHTFPSGELVEVLRRGLQLAVEEKRRKKFAKTKSPRASRADAEVLLTAAVKREVWERDGGRCAWTYPDGRVCRSRWMIEFGHIVSPKHGGSSKADNVRLECREHNEQHARDVFGDELIDEIKRRKRRRKD